MNKGLRGTVVQVRPELLEERLKVVASVKADTGEIVEAHMPDREVSAFLPRSVLLGTGTSAPASLLDTLGPILARMTEGRQVRVWQYRERWFFSFPTWRRVRFIAEAVADTQGSAAEAPKAP